ncbi:RluA family pseudouridine synthase [Desulfonema magnum]|uniref:Pseudouridine synthase, RluC/RluD-like n=1 Tax=Desulfonema magnum TaxID=45655 RepID=A0A975BIF2_9BACT|nr:RNA pseudouridine synthase [Desulfonema magnum]QTA85645.1 Pseudouridine synthase, RluC/RluD-like [Desulfonema magnum]
METIITPRAPIPVLAKGKGWLAVDKPCDISVHNEPGTDLCSILKTYIETTPLFSHALNYEPGFGLHAVHRLDKETSGVILLACRPDIFRYYSKQFESRSVQKHYIALLHGKLSVKEGEDKQGLWQWPLSKTPGGRDCPAGKGKRVECRTRFRVLRHTLRYTLAECELLTGRKHQIRRHAKMAGHPVVGDQRYGTRRSLNYLKNHCGFHRLGLHSFSLTVLLPGKKKPETIESRGIPPEILQLSDEDHAGK